MPKGQSTEQYKRPKMRVSAIRKINTKKLTASNAGTNCIFANAAKYLAVVPLKSANNTMATAKHSAAATSLRYFNECDFIM